MEILKLMAIFVGPKLGCTPDETWLSCNQNLRQGKPADSSTDKHKIQPRIFRMEAYIQKRSADRTFHLNMLWTSLFLGIKYHK